ncbi:MAG: hypothetical protein Q9221_003565 [Calogaya cf. arnoldii]
MLFQVALHETLLDLRSVANVCRLWRSAAVPYLFRKVAIRFSWAKAKQLESLESFLQQSSPYGLFIRELEIQGDQPVLFQCYLGVLLAGLKYLHSLSHFSWSFAGNIPEHLFQALNYQGNLVSLQIRFFPPPKPDKNCFGFLRSSTKTISLIVCGSELFSNVITRDRPSPPNFLLDESLHSDLDPHLVRKSSARTRHNVTSKSASGLPGPVLEALIMDGHNVNRWRQHDPSTMLDVRSLKRLTLENSENPIFVPWQLYPPDLEVLEIVNPVRTFPINADLYLREQLLARPLSQFRTLKVLNLQHVGAPIREVLFHLHDGGKNLQVLRLHDREISGFDMVYRFQRHQSQNNSTEIYCPFPKLLAYLCPNLHTLSLDISPYGLEQDSLSVQSLGSDSFSAALEPLMEDLAKYPTFSVSETLRSLKSLRHLRLVTSRLWAECDGQGALKFAERLWSPKLKSFTLVVSASADLLRENDIVLGTQSEWCVMSRGSNDATPHENYNLYLQDGHVE